MAPENKKAQNGLSDFHKVTMTILGETITEGNPKSIVYRDYKSFDKNKFNEELNSKIKKERKIETFQHIKIFS